MMAAMPLLGAGISAFGSIMQGRAQASAARFEQQQLRRQEQVLRTQASQAEARRREDLTASMETVMALRAGRGVGMGSPTGRAMFESVVEDEERDIRTERLSYLMRADSARMGAVMAGQRARQSLMAGYLGAGSAIVGGFGRAMNAS
jgi:hypothetical protein